MKFKPWHIVNKSELGSVSVCEDRFTFLVSFKHFQLALSPIEIACFKDFMLNRQEQFHWFTTLLDVKALVSIEELGIQLVLSKQEIEELLQLLMETQLIIESRLLTLPNINAGGLNG